MKKPLDFLKIQSQLLRVLRGPRSQLQLSRRIGYRSNTYHRWETGEARISWTDFVKLTLCTKTPLKESLREILHFPGKISEPQDLIRHLVGNLSQNYLKTKLEVSRTVISRWMNGKLCPTFDQMLRLMVAGKLEAVDFVNHLTFPHVIPALIEKKELLQKEREIHYRFPWAGAVLRIFETEEYIGIRKHTPGFVAKRLGISLHDEEETIASLVSIGAANFENGKYIANSKYLWTRGDQKGEIRIRQFWNSRAIRALEKGRYESESGKMSWGYKVFGLTSEGSKELRDVYLKFYHEIESLVSKYQGDATEVYYMGVQILPISVLSEKP